MSAGGHTGCGEMITSSCSTSTGRRTEKKARRSQASGPLPPSRQGPPCHSQPRKSRTGRDSTLPSASSAKPVRRPRITLAAVAGSGSNGAIQA